MFRDRLTGTYLTISGCEGERFIRRLTEVIESDLDIDPIEEATFLNGMAFLYNSQGRYAEEAAALERALGILEEQPEPEALTEFAMILHNLGLLYYYQDQNNAAEATLRRAVRIFEGITGSNHPNAAMSLSALGRVVLGGGDPFEAETLLRRSVEIMEEG